MIEKLGNILVAARRRLRCRQRPLGLQSRAACDKARSVLLDQVFFSLDAEKFRRFTKLLDAPPARALPSSNDRQINPPAIPPG